MNFLEHEVRIITKFSFTPFPIQRGDFGIGCSAIKSTGLDSISANLGQISVLKTNHLLGQRLQRQCIARNPIFSRTYPDDQWRAVSGTDDFLMTLKDNANTPSSPSAFECTANGCQRFRTVRNFSIDHMHQDFRIRFRTQFDSFSFEMITKAASIFNNPIVDQGNLSIC